MVTSANAFLLAIIGAGLVLPSLAGAEIPRPSEGEQLKGAVGVVYDVPHAPYEATTVRVLKFNDDDREVIRDYLKRHFVPPCPAGVSHNRQTGCFSSARNSDYTIGRPLRSHVSIKSVPSEVLAKLSPLPQGYQYVMVDKDVLLTHADTREVYDAVTLVWAVSY